MTSDLPMLPTFLHGSDKKLEAELLEEEAQLQTIEMELIMPPEEL